MNMLLFFSLGYSWTPCHLLLAVLIVTAEWMFDEIEWVGDTKWVVALGIHTSDAQLGIQIVITDLMSFDRMKHTSGEKQNKFMSSSLVLEIFCTL